MAHFSPPSESISQVTLAGTITNQGWVSNATILPDATLTGGTLTGFVTNQGTLSNIQFVGDTLTGGQLTDQINEFGLLTFHSVCFYHEHGHS